MAGLARVRRASSAVSSPVPFWAVLFTIAMLLGSSLPVAHDVAPTLQDVSAQTTSQPCVENTIGASRIRTCITAPADDATVSGRVPVQVSLTAVSGGLPGVQRVRFFLSPASSSSTSLIAASFGQPYTLDLPTDRWVDGRYRLQAEVLFQDGSVTSRPLTFVTLANGTTVPPRSDGSWTPVTSGASPLHVVAVGDGADGLPGPAQVANLAIGMDPDLLLYLGDVYDQGTYTEYLNYYEPTLGPLRGRTNPVPGNHEAYSGFSGYMDYWNSNRHYYSYDSGGWHFIALDSTTEYGQTGPGTPQFEWLRQDLQSSAAACTLVYMHHPRFGLESVSAGSYLQDIWALLATNGVDVVLAGHNHNYQRWTPIDANGQAAPDGIQSYVVGTGGHTPRTVTNHDGRAQFSTTANGALSMTLRPDGGTATFVSTSGQTLDQSSFDCEGGTGTLPTPTATMPGTTTLTLGPVADAMVTSAQPTTNLGTSPALGADSEPVETSYLRFDVQGLSGPATSARLRLWVTNGTANGPRLHRVTDTAWSETSITYNSRPAVGTALGDVGSASVGSWIEYDVRNQITRNGLVSFALQADSSDGIDLVSREGTAGQRPQLIVQGPSSGTAPTVTTTPNPSATIPASVTPTATTTVTATQTSTATIPPGGPLVLAPVADAGVNAGQPSTNFGTQPVMVVDTTNPNGMGYLRFTVQGLSGTPTSVTLRIYASNGTSNGPRLVRVADTSWSETGITWNNRPATGAQITNLGRVNAGSWVEIDVTGAVGGNGSYSFALVPESSDGADFVTREGSAAQRPQLVINGGTGGVSPTATVTVAPTATATRTATATATASATTIPTATVRATNTPTIAPTATATVTPTNTPATAPTATATTPPSVPISLSPVVDAGVEEGRPTTNLGTATTIVVDTADPNGIGYVRFTIQTNTGPISSARLRFWLTNGSTDGPRLVAVSDTGWSETGITWNNRPATGATIGNVGTANAGTWMEYDVKSVVTSAGPVSFALIPESSNGIDITSREGATAQRPQLVINGGGASAATDASARSVAEGPTQTELAGNTAQAAETPEALTGTVVNTGGQGLRCRVAPSTDGAILGTLPEGSTVPVTGPSQGDFTPVECVGQSGYAATAYLDITGTTPATAPTAPPITTTDPTVVPTEPVAETPVVETPVPTAAGEAPAAPTAEPTPAATPLPVLNGWQPDATVPWWWTTDDDPATTWQGTVLDPATPLELGYDLGTVQPLEKLVLQPTWPMTGSIELRLSADGVSWYELRTIDLSRERPEEDLVIPVDAPARYVTLVVSHPAGTGPVGTLLGFEAWADADGVVQPLERLTRYIEPTPTPAPVVPTEVPPTPVPTAVPTPEPVVLPTEVPVPTEAPPVEVPPTELPATEEPPTEEVLPDVSLETPAPNSPP